MIKLNPTEKFIKEEAIRLVNEWLDQQFKEIDSKIHEKTIIYFVWSVFALLLLFIPLSQAIFYVCSLILVLFFLYFIWKFFKLLTKIIRLVITFESKIKQIVKKGLEKEQKKSVLKKIATTPFLSGLKFKDIENLCISHSVREISRRFKKYKKLVIKKISVYSIVCVIMGILFREILFKLFV